MPITAIYAGVLCTLLIFLSARVIGFRRANKVSLGDGDSKELFARIRAHANCAEYVPIGIILLGLLESMHAAPLALHALGSAFVAGRVAHGYGLSQTPQVVALRVGGMVTTLTVLGIAAAWSVWLGVVALK
jgi:uncharacterized protein